MTLEQILAKLARNAIKISMEPMAQESDADKASAHSDISAEHESCADSIPDVLSRFGGRPDVPSDFVWPVYAPEWMPEGRPLAFLLQINCAELKELDDQSLLPDHGLLSFFYDLEELQLGDSKDDFGCGQVLWFEETDNLSPASYPEKLPEDSHFPEALLKFSSRKTLPSWEEMCEITGITLEDDHYMECCDRVLGSDRPFILNATEILGWPDVLQAPLFSQCDRLMPPLADNKAQLEQSGKEAQPGAQGGAQHGEHPDSDAAAPSSSDIKDIPASLRWQQLLQLDGVSLPDFNLGFGDDGMLNFCISTDDLKERRFERTWVIYQSC